MTKMPEEFMQEHSRLCIVPGTIYVYSHNGGCVDPEQLAKKCPQCGSRYRLLGLAKHGRTHQEQVVYEGVTGPDAGKWFVCSVHDFALRLTLLVEEPSHESHVTQFVESTLVVEKVAGYTSASLFF